jgi:pyruvate dehydrogenase E1 component alpha subunit
MFVPVERAHPVEDIASLAQGYGMPGVVVDGQDVVAVAEAVMPAVERAREGKGPSLIECKCLRFCAHAVGIPDYSGYDLRTDQEIAELRKRDPIRLCRERLMEQEILTQEDVERIDREAAAEVSEAERFADESPIAEPSCLAPALYAS